MATFLEIATPLAERGIPVIPVLPLSKRGFLEDQFRHATTDLCQIAQWNTENCNFNVGCVGKPDGIVVLDCDVPGLRRRIEKETRHKFPATLTVRSAGKGCDHLYFRQTDVSRYLGNQSSRGLFDLQSADKYVVGPGSRLDNGKSYDITDDSPIAEFPDWLENWILANADIPKKHTNGKDARPVDESFDIADFLEHYGIGYQQDGEWYITDACPVAGRRHEQSTRTGFFFDGNSLGFHCFATGCEGSAMTVGQVIKFLNQDHEPYTGAIWEGVECDFPDFAEDVTATDAMPEAAPIPPVKPNGHIKGVNAEGQAVIAPSKARVADLQAEPKEMGARKDDATDILPELAEPEQPPQVVEEDYTKHVTIPPEATVHCNTQPDSQPVTPLDMPEDCLYGWIGQKARELHAPLGAAYMVVTSIFAAQRTTICGNIQPNLYILLIAPAHGGKTVTMMRGLKSFSLLPPDLVKKRNLASDRGIYTLFNPDQGKKKAKKERKEEPPQETKSYLLFSREFKDTLNKLSMNGSSLAPVLCDLFDDYEGGTSDKFGDHSVMCCLNILGAIPVNSPADFGKQFGKNTGGGFYDRFIYAPLPKGWNWNHEWVPNPEARFPKDPVQVPSFCYRMANDWKGQGIYWDVERDRLAEIALRIATIWTSANHEKEVTQECMECALRFVTWQEKVRHHYAAGVAENLAAECTSAIMTAFGTHRDAVGKTVHARWRDVSRKHNWHRTYGDLLAKQRDALIKDKVLLPRVIKDENGQAVKDVSWLRLYED